MTTFPLSTPNGRTLTLGDKPQLTYAGVSGATVKFLQGVNFVQQTLELVYNSLSESEIQSLYTHYNDQQSNLLPFDLPLGVWSGYSSVPVSAVDYKWRYAAPFQVSPSSVNRFSVTVELESVID
jgi:hypothetical protein